MASWWPQTPEEASAWVSTAFVRLVGLAALLIGITGLVLTGWAAYTVHLLERPTGTALAFVGGFLAVAAFFLYIGWRILLNRPNRYGSIFSPAAWRVMGAVFALLGVGFFVGLVGMVGVTLYTIALIAIPAAQCWVFSYMCFLAAGRAAANAEGAKPRAARPSAAAR